MKHRLVYLAMATGLVSLAACKESTSPALFDSATVTADVAASAGDAVATAVETLTGNELGAALPAPGVAFNLFGTNGNLITINRTRTCYDASNVVVAGCSPISSVRKVVTHVTIDGSRSGTNTTTGGATVSFSGALHRVSDDTLTRAFNTASPPADTARTHSGLQTSHDTTSFSSGTVNRTHVEAAVDSTIGVTWLLPRTSHPFPVSGHITRVDSVTATFSNGTTTQTRSLVKVVTVTFPPDSQGNVTLTIDGKTCSLNLVTHKVTCP